MTPIKVISGRFAADAEEAAVEWFKRNFVVIVNYKRKRATDGNKKL